MGGAPSRPGASVCPQHTPFGAFLSSPPLLRPARCLAQIDERLLRLARTRGHTPLRDRAVRRFSRLGEHAAIWLALGALSSRVGARERRAQRLRATGLLAASYGLNSAIKLIVRRRRPELPGLPALTRTPTRYSFPSAHATTSFAAARALRRAGLPGAPLYGLAEAMALSRLYLGVHYPSDVLAGAALGTGLGALAR